MAAPPRPLTGGPHAWLRGYLLWDAYYAVVFGVVAGMIATERGVPAGQRAAALALLAGIAAGYVAYARPLIKVDDEGIRGLIYLAGALVLFVPAVVLVPSASFALFALCPLAFWLQPVGRAAVAVVVLNAVPVLVNLWRSPEDVLAGPLPVALIAIMFSLVFGVWAHRIINQSRDRAALIDELAATRAEVAQLSRAAGAAAERERLAAEIHDTLAQGFISIVTLLQAADSELGAAPAKARRHLELALRTARENLAEARSLVAALPPPLQVSSLEEAVARLVTGVAEEHGIGARFSIEGEPAPLPPPIEVVMLRATQEALANVRKHAAAGAVTVRLAYAADRVRLEVADDGIGFEPVPAEAGRPGTPDDGGFGLRAMRGRAEQVGGTVTVRSAPGAGTTVAIEVPR